MLSLSACCGKAKISVTQKITGFALPAHGEADCIDNNQDSKGSEVRLVDKVFTKWCFYGVFIYTCSSHCNVGNFVSSTSVCLLVATNGR